MNAMKEEDQFLKDLFKEGETKSSLDMTESVMHRIDNSSNVFEYRPLISKKAWTMIGAIFLIAFIYLLMQTESMAIKTPELIEVLNSGFLKVVNSFDLTWKPLELPQIPSTLLMALAAFNIIGVFLILSYKWKRRMFSR